MSAFGKMQRVEEILNFYRKETSERLAHIEGLTERTNVLNETFQLKNEPRMFPGGDKCDCCGRTLEELGVTTLEFCGRCQKTFYCSSDCQRKAWNNGHEQVCRKPNQIKPGDIMRLACLIAKPEYNGWLVEIVSADDSTPGRWRVKVVGETEATGLDAKDRIISVATKNPIHLRPLK